MTKDFNRMPALIILIFLGYTGTLVALPLRDNIRKNQLPVQEALDLVDNTILPDSNTLWPNVNTRLLLKNIKENILSPERIYQGNNTFFCGYAAVTYLMVKENPKIYAQCLLDIFEKGTATIGRTVFKPGKSVREAAGTFTQKGALDSAHADQLWFLCLADEFKCYLNLFNHRFNPGDEDNTWASTSYSKFNRMVKRLTGNAVESIGSDFIKPPVDYMQEYVTEQLAAGDVVLFVNRRIKDKIAKGIKIWLPRHYIVVNGLTIDKSSVSIQFWDYGAVKEKKMSKRKFRKTVYGISTVYTSQPGKNVTAGLQ